MPAEKLKIKEGIDTETRDALNYYDPNRNFRGLPFSHRSTKVPDEPLKFRNAVRAASYVLSEEADRDIRELFDYFQSTFGDCRAQFGQKVSIYGLPAKEDADNPKMKSLSKEGESLKAVMAARRILDGLGFSNIKSILSLGPKAKPYVRIEAFYLGLFALIMVGNFRTFRSHYEIERRRDYLEDITDITDVPEILEIIFDTFGFGDGQSMDNRLQKTDVKGLGVLLFGSDASGVHEGLLQTSEHRKEIERYNADWLSRQLTNEILNEYSLRFLLDVDSRRELEKAYARFYSDINLSPSKLRSVICGFKEVKEHQDVANCLVTRAFSFDTQAKRFQSVCRNMMNSLRKAVKRGLEGGIPIGSFVSVENGRYQKWSGFVIKREFFSFEKFWTTTDPKNGDILQDLDTVLFNVAMFEKASEAIYCGSPNALKVDTCVRTIPVLEKYSFGHRPAGGYDRKAPSRSCEVIDSSDIISSFVEYISEIEDGKF